MIESLFPDVINQYLKVFFDTIKDIKEFNPEIFQNIFAEEGLADDPALMDALHQAVHASVKGEIVDVDVE